MRASSLHFALSQQQKTADPLSVIDAPQLKQTQTYTHTHHTTPPFLFRSAGKQQEKKLYEEDSDVCVSEKASPAMAVREERHSEWERAKVSERKRGEAGESEPRGKCSTTIDWCITAITIAITVITSTSAAFPLSASYAITVRCINYVRRGGDANADDAIKQNSHSLLRSGSTWSPLTHTRSLTGVAIGADAAV